MDKSIMYEYIKIKDIAIMKDKSLESTEYLNSFKDDNRKVPITNSKMQNVAIAALNFINEDAKNNKNHEQSYYYEVFESLSIDVIKTLNEPYEMGGLFTTGEGCYDDVNVIG